MYLSQTNDGRVIWREGDIAQVVNDFTSCYELAKQAISSGQTVAETVSKTGLDEVVDLAGLLAEGMLNSPIHHPDPAHTFVTGTGLTHLGSAATRDAMHAGDKGEDVTDSMKMFRMGLENGKPNAGETGVQPEWFYKGSGIIVRSPGEALTAPSFALDGGEEPEVAGIYIIGDDGTPFRLGFALANEFSDHVTELQNYLYLAHSKLRATSFGPEILVGDLPEDIKGTSRITRGKKVLWEKPFLSGEDNMSHTISNLEYHHFKYDLFCQPGDLHVHMFGTATLSFADGITVEEGDQFEISAPDFGLPLCNPLAKAHENKVCIKRL